MGRVYEAEHIDIGRRVAIKVLHASFHTSAELVERFRREARAASKIGHPNIVDVTDSGTTPDGAFYFVMEYLDGDDLDELIDRDGPLPVERALLIAAQICRALEAAHAADVIHRDLKPANIMLVNRKGEDDFVKVLDFGISKDLDLARASDGAALTRPDIAIGTPEYMAPEQAAGQAADALHRRLRRRRAAVRDADRHARPARATTRSTSCTRRRTRIRCAIGELRPDLPPEVQRLVMRALARVAARSAAVDGRAQGAACSRAWRRRTARRPGRRRCRAARWARRRWCPSSTARVRRARGSRRDRRGRGRVAIARPGASGCICRTTSAARLRRRGDRSRRRRAASAGARARREPTAAAARTALADHRALDTESTPWPEREATPAGRTSGRARLNTALPPSSARRELLGQRPGTGVGPPPDLRGGPLGRRRARARGPARRSRRSRRRTPARKTAAAAVRAAPTRAGPRRRGGDPGARPGRLRSRRLSRGPAPRARGDRRRRRAGRPPAGRRCLLPAGALPGCAARVPGRARAATRATRRSSARRDLAEEGAPPQ